MEKIYVLVDEIAVFVDSAQPGQAFAVLSTIQPGTHLGNDCVLQRGTCGSMGSGLIPGRAEVIGADLDKWDADGRKMPARMPAPAPYIASMAKRWPERAMRRDRQSA